MKKYISILLTLSMALSLSMGLSVIGLAAGAEITAAVQGTYTQSDAEQDVTIRISVNGLTTPYCLFAIDTGITLPEGFAVKSFSTSNTSQAITAGDYNTANGKLTYMTSDMEDTIPANTYYEVVIAIPANTSGSYQIVLKNVYASNIYATNELVRADTITVPLTITGDGSATTGYTVSIADETDGTAEVEIGEAVTMSVTVDKPVNGIQAFATYDPALFSCEDDIDEDGVVEVYKLVNETFTDAGSLTFTAIAAGTGDFGFQSAVVGGYDDFSTDAVEASVLTDTVTVKTPGFDVAVAPDYVTGWTLVTVVGGNAAGYTYDGTAMFYVEQYEAYAYLVEGAVTEAAAAAQVAVAAEGAAYITIADSYDVNNTGKVDFYDAGAAFGCYNEAYDVAKNMAMYLRADVNSDRIVDGKDVSAIMSNYSN